jgi:plastocyanin
MLDMKWLSIFVTVAMSLGLFTSRTLCADLSGQIVITKKIAKKQVTLPAYQLRGAPPARTPDNSGPANECSSVVVFLEGHSSEGAKPIRVELQQRGQRFDPQLLVIPAGSTVSFPNADPIFHNVFSLSGTKKFDLGYYPAGQTRIITFDEPGVVQVYCHLHPNMYAAIVVVPNRWYTQPSEDGTFSLHDVPPGSYHLVAWHLSGGYFRREVEVTAKTGADVTVHIPVRNGDHDR